VVSKDVILIAKQEGSSYVLAWMFRFAQHDIFILHF